MPQEKAPGRYSVISTILQLLAAAAAGAAMISLTSRNRLLMKAVRSKRISPIKIGVIGK
jgi:hypothetical protein